MPTGWGRLSPTKETLCDRIAAGFVEVDGLIDHPADKANVV